MFVTVGTTEFDELIRALDARAGAVSAALSSLGCTQLVVQMGRGTVVPEQLVSECNMRGIEARHYRFKDTLAEDIASADLVVSHCGAGSVLEVLEQHKLLLIVVNPSLQGNHQSELAEAMLAGKHCLSCSPGGVVGELERLVAHGGAAAVQAALLPYPEPDLEAFPHLVDSLFRW